MLTALVLVVACTGESVADRVRRAGEAPDVGAALALCGEEPRCGLQALARFSAWEKCGELPTLEGEECRFLHAEALERADDAPAALAQCAGIRWATECASHVLAQSARRPESMDKAIERWSALKKHTEGRLAFSYWRAFWHHRIGRGDAPGLETCPDPVCRMAGEREIEATIDMIGVPCGVERPAPGWIPAESPASTTLWRQATARLCHDPSVEPRAPRPPPPR